MFGAYIIFVGLKQFEHTFDEFKPLCKYNWIQANIIPTEILNAFYAVGLKQILIWDVLLYIYKVLTWIMLYRKWNFLKSI